MLGHHFDETRSDMAEADLPTVLFVDDEPDLLAGIRLNLRRQPFRVVTTTSTAEAFELLGAGGIAVVVSDERMPEMSGSRFLTLVRERHPEVERIILTGEASTQATIAAINDARVFRFLTKPCSPEDIAGTVLEALHAHRSRAAEAHRSGAELRLTEHLDLALDQIWIALQPIVSATTGEEYAYEVLLRSDHEVLTSPLEVLDAATRLARHYDVDRMIRVQAAAVLPHLPSGVSLFVNLMPESLADPQLTSAEDPLTRWADRVVLEITERVELDTIPDVEDHIAELRRRGYRIALDDLGAGYSGLNSFALVKPDVVKFDMALVRGVDERPTQAKLISSMARLCKDLNILTVAEGVESEAEQEKLVGLGCDLLQGFRIGRPAPALTATTRSDR